MMVCIAMTFYFEWPANMVGILGIVWMITIACGLYEGFKETAMKARMARDDDYKKHDNTETKHIVI